MLPPLNKLNDDSAAGGFRPSVRQFAGSSDIRGVGIAIDIGDDLIEQIAERAAKLITDRRSETTGDGWLRGAEKIGAYIDAPRSRVYGLASARRIPVHHDGSALIARRSELDAWLLAGGSRRP
jgi:hypothetical protein